MNLLLQKKLGSKPDPQWANLVSHASELRKRNRWDDIVLQAQAAVGLTRSSAACIEPAIELLCRVSTTITRLGSLLMRYFSSLPTHSKLQFRKELK